MTQENPEDAARRLELALDMFGFGEDLFRQNLRRENPDLSEAEIEKALKVWLRTRPGAEENVDLRALLGKATDQDVQAARRLLKLIHERGFARGKDLLSELQGLL